MTVPCRADNHWRKLWLGIVVDPAVLSVSEIRARLRFGDAESSFGLADAGCSGSGELLTAPAALGERQLISLSTTRDSAEQQASGTKNNVPTFSHDEVLAALEASMLTSQILVAASVEMSFSRGEASWRIPLLANPLSLTETQSSLGRVELSGLKLRFTESPVGLIQATFGSEAEQALNIELVFGVSLARESISRAYELVLEQAESWAAIFIELQPAPAVEEAATHA